MSEPLNKPNTGTLLSGIAGTSKREREDTQFQLHNSGGLEIRRRINSGDDISIETSPSCCVRHLRPDDPLILASGLRRLQSQQKQAAERMDSVERELAALLEIGDMEMGGNVDGDISNFLGIDRSNLKTKINPDEAVGAVSTENKVAEAETSCDSNKNLESTERINCSTPTGSQKFELTPQATLHQSASREAVDITATTLIDRSEQQQSEKASLLSSAALNESHIKRATAEINSKVNLIQPKVIFETEHKPQVNLISSSIPTFIDGFADGGGNKWKDSSVKPITESTSSRSLDSID